ncbi:hypothetical protein INT45_001380 [Circinella minor]|uniref:Uncharacterized protein n=1 Tax=Circinella minor TaxID=1195481 RepID=A0A8H7RTM0_9FUNG|nr:hypothetical protein INT45_001380 [Circinella minor]
MDLNQSIQTTSFTWGNNLTVDQDGGLIDANQQQQRVEYNAQEVVEMEEPNEAEKEENERLRVLDVRCFQLMQEFAQKKASLAVELGASLEEVERRCGNHITRLFMTTKARSGWNSFVAKKRSQELETTRLLKETNKERIKRYSQEYTPDVKADFKAKAEKHNLDLGLKGYVALADLTPRANKLRSEYAKDVYSRKWEESFGCVAKHWQKAPDMQIYKPSLTSFARARWLMITLHTLQAILYLKATMVNQILARQNDNALKGLVRMMYFIYTNIYADLIGLRHAGPVQETINYIKEEIRKLYNAQAPSFGQLQAKIPWTELRKGKDRYVLLDPLPENVRFGEPSRDLKSKNDIGLD